MKLLIWGGITVLFYILSIPWAVWRIRFIDGIQNAYFTPVKDKITAHQVARNMLHSLDISISYTLQLPLESNLFGASCFIKDRKIEIHDYNSRYHIVCGMHEAGHLFDAYKKGKRKPGEITSKNIRHFLIFAFPLLMYIGIMNHSLIVQKILNQNELYLLAGLVMILFSLEFIYILFQENSAWVAARKYNDIHKFVPDYDFQRIRNVLYPTYFDIPYIVGSVLINMWTKVPKPPGSRTRNQ